MTMNPAVRIWHVVRPRWRLFSALACGLLARVALPAHLSAATAAVIAWDIGVLVYLVLASMLFAPPRVERMAEHAEEPQEGEWTIFCLTMAAVAFSFAAIISEFAHAGSLPPARRELHIALVAVTLLLSWLMTQTTFGFRYAREYYAHDPGGADFDRALEFPGERRPDQPGCMDFSLVLGMTFQVSDVEITSRKLRRVGAVRGLLGFLFNTIILALTVNIAAGPA